MADLPVSERKLGGGEGLCCYELFPNPSVVVWGRSYRFTLCCCDREARPRGIWRQKDASGEILELGFIDPGLNDPCIRFIVKIVQQADVLEIDVKCAKPKGDKGCFTQTDFTALPEKP